MKAVVIVEDDPDIQSLIETIFSMDPRFSVAGLAESAEDALELTRTAQPEIIVLDDRLAGALTGVDAVPQFKEAAPGAKIILFTAHADLQARVVDQPDIDAFLLKTVRVNEASPMTSGDLTVEQHHSADAATSAKVLVVIEDDEDVQFLIESLFSIDPRFTVSHVAESAEEALDLPPTSEPGIIVLDHGLAGPLPGLAAAPLLKERAPQAKIIMFTAHAALQARATRNRPSTRSCSRRSQRSSYPWPSS